MAMSGRSMLQSLLGAFGAQSWIDASVVAVRRYAPAPPTWPADLPLRVAVLSDFHFCEPWLGLQGLETIVEMTNGLEPHLILLLGDFEEGPRFSHHIPAPHWAEILGRLRAPLGVHAVLGNHDYPRYWRNRHRHLPLTEAEAALRTVGIPVLVNQAIPLNWQGKELWLAGLGDQRTDHLDGSGLADLAATLAPIPVGAPAILMAHEPDIFPEVPGPVSLTLSGHVHRGQIRFFGYAPVVPSRYGRRYLHGHVVENDRHLIVSAGLGHSGLPLRFDAKPEILLIDLGGRID